MININKLFRLWTEIFQMVIFLGTVFITGSVSAQTVTTNLNLPTILNAEVIPGQITAQITIPISASNSMRLQVIAPVNGVSLSLLDPNGSIILPPLDLTVSFLDGSQLTPQLPGGVFITPTINTPADGDWFILLNFPAATEKTVIVATVFTDTVYQVGIIVNQDEYRVDQTTAIGMIILNNGQPITNLTPSITVTPPTGLPDNFIGNDNGDPADLDGLADDGIYSGSYTFTEVGTYTITSDVSIPTNTGTTIQRMATKTINVTDSFIDLVSVNGNINLRSDGCIDGMNLHISVDGLIPSTYVANARLNGSNGQFIEKSTSQELLAPGSMLFDLFFSSDEIRNKIMIDGAYVVSPVDLLSFQTNGVHLEVRDIDSFTFPAISLANLCIPPISITQALNVSQTLRNGFIESLQFSFPVTVANAGIYQISLKVTGGNGQDIELFGFSQFMNVGNNTVAVSIPYDKFQTIDGPYSIESVLILGQGKSAQASLIGSSGSLSSWQFFPHITGDLDFDGDVDASDRRILLGFRNLPALTPGDRRDLTGDGRIDLRDARFIIRLACPAGSCPIN